MTLMGIGDEAGPSLSDQIKATKDLGWSYIEMRAVQVGDGPKANIHDISDAEFNIAVEQLNAAGLKVHCFGSAIMNWQKTVAMPFSVTEAEVARAIPRMQRFGAKFVRIMSYKPGVIECSTPKIVFQHVCEVTRRFLAAGIQPVHENCMNFGGMSCAHTLELLDRCPGLKLVFDTGNPVFNPDRRGSWPWQRQNAWEFWEQVRDHVVHIHIKDAIWNNANKKETYTWPGEGHGYIRRIIEDAIRRGYDGGVSIEPHMVAVFHDAQAQTVPADAARENFVSYGRRLEDIIDEARRQIPANP